MYKNSIDLAVSAYCYYETYYSSLTITKKGSNDMCVSIADTDVKITTDPIITGSNFTNSFLRCL